MRGNLVLLEKSSDRLDRIPSGGSQPTATLSRDTPGFLAGGFHLLLLVMVVRVGLGVWRNQNCLLQLSAADRLCRKLRVRRLNHKLARQGQLTLKIDECRAI